MADGNQAFHDDIVRRRIALDNLSQSQTRELTKFLKEAEKDLIAKIANLPENAVKARAAQTKLLENLKDLYEDAYSNVQSGIERNLKALAGTEAKTYADSIAQHAHNGSGVTVTTQQLSASAAYSIATSTPMQGKFVNKSIRDLPDLQRDRIEQQLRIGFAQGESLTSIKKRIRGMTNTNATHLESFIRTANTHIASQVHRASNEMNKDLIEYEVWSTVLDSRTSRICMGLSGKKYKIGEGPYPPQHFRCRSVRYPVLKGSDPPKEETYQQWIARQPASVQDEILGKNRAKLLRDGGVTIDRFSNNNRGRSLEIERVLTKAEKLEADAYGEALVARQEAIDRAMDQAIAEAKIAKAAKAARRENDDKFLAALNGEKRRYERAIERAKEIEKLTPEQRSVYRTKMDAFRKKVSDDFLEMEADERAYKAGPEAYEKFLLERRRAKLADLRSRKLDKNEALELLGDGEDISTLRIAISKDKPRFDELNEWVSEKTARQINARVNAGGPVNMTQTEGFEAFKDAMIEVQSGQFVVGKSKGWSSLQHLIWGENGNAWRPFLDAVYPDLFDLMQKKLKVGDVLYVSNPGDSLAAKLKWLTDKSFGAKSMDKTVYATRHAEMIQRIKQNK